MFGIKQKRNRLKLADSLKNCLKPEHYDQYSYHDSIRNTYCAIGFAAKHHMFNLSLYNDYVYINGPNYDKIFGKGSYEALFSQSKKNLIHDGTLNGVIQALRNF